MTIQQFIEIVKDKTNQRYNKLPRKEKKQIDALRSLNYLKLKAAGSKDFQLSKN